MPNYPLKKIKYLYSFSTGFTPDTTDSEAYSKDDEGYNWITITDMDKKYVSNSTRKLTDKGIKGQKKWLVKKGSLLYSFKLSVGKVAFAEEDLYTNEAIASFYSDINDLNFLYYTAPLYIEKNANVNIYGAKILNQELIKNSKIPFPSIKKQREIVSILDEKITIIDLLIETLNQEILEIENLKLSIIDETIFNIKGDRELVNRGWVKYIPASWQIKRLKFVFSINKGLNITKENLIDNGLPVISYGQTHNSDYMYEFNPTDNPLPGVDSSYLICRKAIMKKGDFIFVDTSEDIKGSANFSMLNNDDFCFAGYHSLLLKPIKKICSRYFRYLFESSRWTDQIKSKVNGVKVYSITQTILSNVDVLVPPINVQEEIANYLDKKLSFMPQLIEIKKTKIEELQKLKISLVYEYVSGIREV